MQLNGQTASGGVTWTLVNSTFNPSCTVPSTTCATTIPAATDGNLLIIDTFTTENVTIASTSGGGTSTHCSNCSAFIPSSGATDISYITSVTGGTTSVSVTLSLSEDAFFAVQITEWHRSTGTATFDVSGNAEPTGCTACTGTALSLTGSDDLIFHAINEQHSFVSIGSPYTVDVNDVYCYLLNATTGTAPVLNQTPSGEAAFSSIAFK